MSKIFSFGFWNSIARVILRNRLVFITIIIGITIFLATQWQHMRFSYTEANLLPDEHEINLVYNDFLEKFGEEGNLIVIAVKDPTLFTPEKFTAWNDLTKKLQSYSEVENVIAIGNLQKLEKFEDPNRFEMVPFVEDKEWDSTDVANYREELFNRLPFYENLVYSKTSNTVQSALYLDEDIVNSEERKVFVTDELQPLIENFEKDNDLEVYVSGMPYIRTLNSQNIIDEIGLFIGAALLVTSIIFFFFFRSVRATVISMVTVMIGVMWAFGVIGLFNYEITVLTALIPPLIIVIGIPNCIFLINKYQQEIKNHGNQAKSLQRVITKVGNATLLTNVTTASGFATFILTDSKLLTEFGIVASINILAIFVLSLVIIPIIYSYMRHPKEKHLKHLNKRWIGGFVDWMERMVRHRRITIYITSVILLAASIIGIYNIRISGSLLEDMPQEADFFQDVKFFEEEFNGVMPLEILIDTKRPRGALSLSNLKRMEELETAITDVPELSSPLSVVRLAKYSKQAYYNGNPKYYQLPTSQEQNFISSYLKGISNDGNLLSAYVDSTAQYARMTTFMKDIGTEEMNRIEAGLWPQINRIFPEDRYDVTMTGKALIFQKGTSYLVKNLIISLSLAIFLIALLMAWMFRSFRMILVSLIPNLLPLLVTAGMMGFLGVPIKPSTILVFSIAFGISVDDTIHFLAKYRQELKANNWKIKRSVYAALRETGVSMFYTSIVLFFGFSVFMISSFGGTVALGGLVSATLLFAMLANLLLLPSLLLSLEKSIANKETLKEPAIEIIAEEDDILKETNQ
ncbi:RND family transporter [Antarcticibacterium flavum]|uniref:RND family transporter n=1 Tax=Antarcticibacterium flavum TaxID=2058175 RepID=A0A5B7X3D4_9FLAO|nr:MULTISPECIES: efflux RND transporter permease subunit [Antarcticibacterium]MCM4159445.1 transporter [Antarcticibacterium sp. W02-3]QCY69917.1 RND family transporter [Antarcticibacterium flavum]